MTVLVIAPHPDDETIGPGGTLCALTDRGVRAVAVYLTSGELGLRAPTTEEGRAVRELEADAAAKVLGLDRTVFLREPDWGLSDRIHPLAQRLLALIEEEAVADVYAPHALDEHPDHAAAHRAVRAALGTLGADAPTLHTYEVWTPLPRWTRAEDVSAAMPRKLEALRAHASQSGHYDYAQAVEGLNRYRGALTTRTAYAEVFGDTDTA